MMSKSKGQMKPCATCLSLCNFEFPLHEELKGILRILLHDFGIDEFFDSIPWKKQLGLCGTCYQTLQDIIAFKKRAINSFNEIKKYRYLNELESHNQRYDAQTESTSETSFDCTVTVVPEVEIKGENDPLETVTQDVLTHTYTAPDPNSISIEVKQEISYHNDGSDSETESADSFGDDWDDAIKKHAVPNTGNRIGSDVLKIVTKDNKPYVYLKDAKKLMNRCSVAQTVMTVTSVTSGPTARTAAATSLVNNRGVNNRNPGPSKPKYHRNNVSIIKLPPEMLNKSKSTYQTETKDQQKTCMEPKMVDSDTDSEVRDSITKNKKAISRKQPWYITVLSREELVRKREERLKDPKFISARYKCYYCASTFPARDTYLTHKRLCHGESKENAEFRCFACSCSFDSLRLFSTHVKYHSFGCHTYQCSTCEYTTDDSYFVTNHKCPNNGGPQVPPKDPSMKLSKIRKQCYCPKCDYLSTKPSLQIHYSCLHTNNPEVDCEYCGKRQRNAISYKQHVYNYHLNKQPREKKVVMFCAPCLMPFYYTSAYQKHMKTFKHTPKDAVRFKCDECPRKFLTDKLLEKHKQMHELVRTEGKNHKCSVCGKSYYLEKILKQHIREKHTDRTITRDHICDICGKAFTQKGILRGHMAKHSDERPYKCKFCGDTFKYSGALYTHTKLKHKRKTKPVDKRKGKYTKKQQCEKSKKKNYKGCEQNMETKEYKQNIESHEHEKSIESQENEQSMESRVYDTETMEF